MDAIIEQIYKLEPKPGEILVIRLGNASQHEVEELSKSPELAAAKETFPDLKIVVMNHAMKFELIDEQTLNALGWFRRDYELP